MVYRNKAKTSIEYINSSLRALDAQAGGERLPQLNDAMGMNLFQRDDPDGYSELGADWIDTASMLERIEFVSELAENRNSAYAWDSLGYIEAWGLERPEDIVAFFDETLYQGTLSEATFTFSGSPAKVRKFIGQLPSTDGGPDGAGLLGAYGGPYDLQEQWDKLIIVTMSEFGRTSRENGSKGTDHGHAGAMFIAGGRVRGGVYNCDAASWPEGDLFSTRDRYVDRRTDFRAVFAEVFARHFGTDETAMETVIPGYTQAALDHPGDFKILNFLPSA